MWYLPLIERELIPDALLRAGIRQLLRDRLRQESAGGTSAIEARQAQLIASLRASDVAIHTRQANEQHYEVPTRFYQRVLGTRLKYSCCLYEQPDDDLDTAERRMLECVVQRARLSDGQDILELGCGWGSFALYAAQRFPRSRVTGISNSRTQREFIESRARELGLTNLRIVTCDINELQLAETFDRIVSVEMFEHVRNYQTLLQRIAGWLNPEGLLFVHIFCHRDLAYAFETDGDNDWMARYFFTGGLMPSAGLLAHFQNHVRLMDQWTVNGQHYERTCNDWLDRMDRARADIWPIFEEAYGKPNARRWFAFWRIFFMSCAELFGYHGGREWFVSHYLFARR